MELTPGNTSRWIERGGEYDHQAETTEQQRLRQPQTAAREQLYYHSPHLLGAHARRQLPLSWSEGVRACSPVGSTGEAATRWRERCLAVRVPEIPCHRLREVRRARSLMNFP